MPDAPPAELEQTLFEALPAYSAACARDDARERHDRLRAIESTLAALLGQRLQASDHWNRFRWVDDLLETVVEHRPHGDVVVRGLAVWFDGQAERRDPFLAVLSTSAKTCALSFGSAQHGLGGWPRGNRWAHWSDTAAIEWLIRA